MQQSFQNKVVVITGGGGGIGSALCRQLLSQDAKIAALDIQFSELSTQQNLLQIKTDITDRKALHEAIEQVIEKFSGIDVLINNAAMTHISLFQDLANDGDLVRKIMAVNFQASVDITQLCLPYLIKSKGSIAAISSVAGFAPLYGRSAYSASKHAMQGFFGSIGAELKNKDVSVTIISPAFVQSRSELTATNDGKLISPGAKKKGTAGEQIKPELASEKILIAIAKRKPYFYLGRLSKIARILFTLFPKFYIRLMTKQAKVEFE